MSETKDQSDKTARGQSGNRTMTLSLKRTVDAGHVRQSFSHGRSKSVLVEKKKRRTIAAPGPGAPGEAEQAAAPEVEEIVKPQAPVAKPPVVQAPPQQRKQSSSGGTQRTLSVDERDARVKALAAAREREADDRRRAEEEARLRAIRDAETKREQEGLKLLQEAEARRKAIENADSPPAKDAGNVAELQPERPRGVAEVAKIEPNRPETRRADTDAGGRGAGLVKRPPERVVEADDDDSPRKLGPHAKKAKVERAPVKKVDEKRITRGRLTIANALDDQQRERSLSALKRRREREKAKAIQAPREKIQREVVIPEAITIQELSNRMAERGVDIIKFLMKTGEMQKITDVIDADTAEIIVAEFGHTSKRVSESDVEEGFIGQKDVDADMVSRAPIVTIMGHVDHGKTSLLDAIRETNVASSEAGGITQHIGAYQVVTKAGNKITFIDTPGHEAFTAMRARGAKVTDIVVLVVAADDGVMPQTIEAINHAKAAGVPMIVAINKMDKPSADPNRVRNELLRHGVVVESMSGETLDVEVSALQKTNLDKLLETIMLQSEILELKANATRSAEGVVIEAKLEAGRGPVGTVLIQRGSLRVGDIIVAGAAWGRVRALISDRGESVREAGPAVPVEVLGLSSAPEAGDQLAVVENEARARELTDYRMRKRRERMAVSGGAARTLEQMMSQLKGEGRKDFALLVKGDVQGSVEAITAALEKLGTEEVGARVVHAAVGGITESDIALASTTGAVIVAFSVRANTQARAHAERDGVEIRYYSVIYDLVDDVKKAMSGLLAPTKREVFLGNAQILEVFNITKVGKVAGCRITEGKVERGAKVRLIRDSVVIHEGTLSTLKRFKDEVKEVPSGQECGMAFANYQDMRQGDIIECFTVEIIIRSL